MHKSKTSSGSIKRIQLQLFSISVEVINNYNFFCFTIDGNNNFRRGSPLSCIEIDSKVFMLMKRLSIKKE